MLDASEQARLLVVLRERQTEMGLGLIVVSHDIALVRKVTDRTVVLDGEAGWWRRAPSNLVSSALQHRTARRLVQSATGFTYDDETTGAFAD